MGVGVAALGTSGWGVVRARRQGSRPLWSPGRAFGAEEHVGAMAAFAQARIGLSLSVPLTRWPPWCCWQDARATWKPLSSHLACLQTYRPVATVGKWVFAMNCYYLTRVPGIRCPVAGRLLTAKSEAGTAEPSNKCP